MSNKQKGDKKLKGKSGGEKKKQEETPAPKIDWIDRLGSLLIDPERVFLKIAERVDWQIPITIMAVTIGCHLLTGIARSIVPMREFYGVYPPDFNTMMTPFMMQLMMLAIYIFGNWMVRTVVFWTVLRLDSTKTDFKKLMSLIGYAWFPHALFTLITTIPSAVSYETIPVMSLNLLALLPRTETFTVFHVIAEQIDLVFIWSLFLIATGIRVLTGKPLKKTIFYSVTYWILKLIFAVLLAGIGNSLMRGEPLQ